MKRKCRISICIIHRGRVAEWDKASDIRSEGAGSSPVTIIYLFYKIRFVTL